MEEVYRKEIRTYDIILLRSSITWIAFPFSSGSLTGSRLGFYLIDTPLPFVVPCPAVVLLHFVANGVWIDDFVGISSGIL
jgi:hypothetical protein